ncbi:PucR family transcriptional regulator [Deinococcus hohokamensis]|uniref:PucR family transcriptional regulator n=1 Tax=Deinococcus hohokamensis TaxID=309883 RepID=A0ABV9I7H3_9DEIO
MPTLAELEQQLGLSPSGPPERGWASLDEAAALLPACPSEQVRLAALTVLARHLVGVPGSASVLTALREAVSHPQPERELTRLLSRLTGGFAAIHASWGDLVASSGEPRAGQVYKLTYGTRQVGTLTVAAGPEWAPLLPVAAEYALLARLQSAAAGAARRRVGERALDALLSGQDDVGGPGLGPGPFALALARFSRSVAGTPAAHAAREQALDVLASAGEGYFMERGVTAFSTVRAGRAVWLWPTRNLGREGRALHAALLASTAQDVRLGVSGRHSGAEVRSAYEEAAQALAGTREARGCTMFQELDPLHALVTGGALDTLQAQVRARLATLDDAERTEATLRAYLGHRGPLAELAAGLNVHVNTLRYRLRRAEEVLGGRLSDPQLLARLYLALEAQELAT